MKKVFERISFWEKNPCPYVWTTSSQGTYHQKSYADFAQEHGFEPNETTFQVPKDEIPILKAIIEHRTLPDNQSATITATFTKPHDKLYLTPMAKPLDDRKIESFGYGIVYNPAETKPINPGTMVSNYSGELDNLAIDKTKDYLFTITESVQINSKNKGNLSRFFAHLPENLELLFFVMPQEIRKSIAKANLRTQECYHAGKAALAIVANQSISPGEVMGFDYSIDYFLKRGTLPVYYNKKGLALDMSRVTFDKRRYLIFSIFNNQLWLYQQVSNPQKEWNNVMSLINASMTKSNQPGCKYFDLEDEFKEIYPKLEKIYFEDKFADELAMNGFGNKRIYIQMLSQLKEILFFNPNNLNTAKIIDNLFLQKFENFPLVHPMAKTHTLNLSNPKQISTRASKPSESGIFSSKAAAANDDEQNIMSNTVKKGNV